jgi:hypothetical protein
MVLLETLGLWLSSIVREGIGWVRRLACFKHGPDLSDGYFPSNRASQEADGHRQEMIPSLHYSQKWNAEEFFVRARQV